MRRLGIAIALLVVGCEDAAEPIDAGTTAKDAALGSAGDAGSGTEAGPAPDGAGLASDTGAAVDVATDLATQKAPPPPALADLAGGSCDVEVAMPPDEGAAHIAACAPVTYGSRP